MAEFSFKAVALSDETQEELFIERFLPGSEISLIARLRLIRLRCLQQEVR